MRLTVWPRLTMADDRVGNLVVLHSFFPLHCIISQWLDKRGLKYDRRHFFCQKAQLLLMLHMLHFPPLFFFLYSTISVPVFLFFLIFLSFLAVLGLRCCARAFSLVAASRGYSLLWCTGFSWRWLLLLWSTGSRHAGFSSCGTWAQ